MVVERVKVSSDFHIEVPVDAREKLHIASGDYLRVEVTDEGILLVPEPRSYVQRYRGLHGEIWRDVDPMTYLDEERDSWEP